MKFTKDEIKQIPNIPGIYKITDIVNNKCYIGQSVSLRKRLYSHYRNCVKETKVSNCYPLYKTAHKYGIEIFEFEILEFFYEIPDINELGSVLDLLERNYISKYDSYNNGYNLTRGGDGGVLGYKMTDEQKAKISEAVSEQVLDGRYKLYCLNIETLKIIESPNSKELSKIINISHHAIRNAKCYKTLLHKKFFISGNKNIISEFEELKNLNNYKEYNIYNSSGVHDLEYLFAYYEYLLSFDRNVEINEIASYLHLTRDTILKRNKRLRDLGYELPINSHNKIKYIEVHNIHSNEILNLSLQEIADMFGITKDSARKQVKRDNIYKKCYYFKVIYED